ncbi:MAG: DUF6715 family protein [Lachnospiraceae bacterium]|nr:DUF6715 family protein [Lachnospiraceae bacterium]
MKNVKKLVTITLIIVLCVILYYRYVNKDDDKSGSLSGADNLSEVEKILTKNLDENYPTTPLEVVKFFTRIQKCYYNEDNTEKVVEDLANTARQLMDESLLANNPEEEYYNKLKQEIKTYKSKKRTITNIIYDKSTEVVYSTVDDVQTASLNCTYYIQTGNRLVTSTETYILRKDENGNWKILGWKLEEPSEWEN